MSNCNEQWNLLGFIFFILELWVDRISASKCEAQMNRMTAGGFCHPRHRTMPLCDSVANLLERFVQGVLINSVKTCSLVRDCCKLKQPYKALDPLTRKQFTFSMNNWTVQPALPFWDFCAQITPVTESSLLNWICVRVQPANFTENIQQLNFLHQCLSSLKQDWELIRCASLWSLMIQMNLLSSVFLSLSLNCFIK